MSAPIQERSLIFSVGRSIGVLVVFEWDHRLILLEPFHMMHKGNFARSAVFMADNTAALMSHGHFAAVQHALGDFVSRSGR
jgi:hypothetical protein